MKSYKFYNLPFGFDFYFFFGEQHSSDRKFFKHSVEIYRRRDTCYRDTSYSIVEVEIALHRYQVKMGLRRK